MEQTTCPVTSTVSNTVESPKPPPLTSCGNASSPKVDRESPEPNCAICLGKTENKSFTDSCLHQFCFSCLLEWSKVKAECPLCKQSFKSIIHNVRSNEDYEEYHIQAGSEPRYWQEEASVVRFRYSTTLTPERQRERLLESLVRPLFYGTDAIPARRINSRRRHRNHTSEFRATVYRENLWVNPLPDVTGRYRECSPEFYRLNPAQLHRLVPWLNRELNVLRVPSSHLMMVVDLILNLLTQYPINGTEFQSRLTPHIGANTSHFLHEFYSFARSPYDMIGFDQSAGYHQRHPGYALEVQTVVSDSDSDIIVLSPTNVGTSRFPSTSQSLRSESPQTRDQQAQPLNLSASSSRIHPGLSPEPGPSGLGNPEDFIVMITRELQNPTYPSIMDRNVVPINYGSRISSPPINNREIQPQLIESDSDDCVIVGYVKPRHERTPEIITLASDVGSEGGGDRESLGNLEETLKRMFTSSSSSSLSITTNDTSDSDYIPNQKRPKKKTPSKRRKIRKVATSSSDDSDSSEMKRRPVPSTDSDTEEEDARRRKSKAKGKRKRVIVSPRDSTDDNRPETNRNNKNRKSRREVWRIVQKQEPTSDHEHSLDSYDPPYTEEEWSSLQTERPKLRSIVITKSASGQREHSYSSVASSSRSSSHYHESKRHRHKSHKKEVKRHKGRRKSESSSPARPSKGKRTKSKRSHRNVDSSS